MGYQGRGAEADLHCVATPALGPLHATFAGCSSVPSAAIVAAEGCHALGAPGRRRDVRLCPLGEGVEHAHTEGVTLMSRIPYTYCMSLRNFLGGKQLRVR
jgi:hypothetical protein